MESGRQIQVLKRDPTDGYCVWESSETSKLRVLNRLRPRRGAARAPRVVRCSNLTVASHQVGDRTAQGRSCSTGHLASREEGLRVNNWWAFLRFFTLLIELPPFVPHVYFRFSFLFFSLQKADMSASKHMRQLTTWKFLCDIKRRFYSLGIEPPTSSLTFGCPSTIIR